MELANIIKGNLNLTGINEIDTNLVSKKWNHLWMIAEWKRDNSWRLIKYVRKDSGITSIKTTIAEEQARELIEKNNLKAYGTVFTSGVNWRRKKDVLYLEKWRRERSAINQVKSNTFN